jgi:hypothetical protein
MRRADPQELKKEKGKVTIMTFPNHGTLIRNIRRPYFIRNMRIQHRVVQLCIVILPTEADVCLR